MINRCLQLMESTVTVLPNLKASSVSLIADTRSALEGYAGEPDWEKLPPFDRLVELGFGAHGVIRDEAHAAYRDHVLGAAKKPSDDGLEL